MIKLRQFQCIGVFIMAMFWNLLMSISSFAQVPCTPASITTEPVLANVCQGDIVTFDIMATGSITGYQWYRNGSMISGATSDSYTITAQSANNGDKFKVIVKSSCGDDTSEEVTLTVTRLPSISINPVGATKCVGDTYTFNVTASNAGGYQWTLDDADITGATNATHTIPSICDICDAGNYKVDVFGTGVCASQHVTSSGADLIVKIPVDITGNPNSQAVCEGTSVTFSATATGDLTGYQWYKNGAILTGATASTYSITAQSSMNGDKYTVVVKGTCGDKTSTEATLNVSAKPSISVNPVGATKCVGETYTFSVTASNAGGYQWLLKDGDISGATNASYSIASICNVCDAGAYKVDVFGTGACASQHVTSSATNLIVKIPVDITVNPNSQAVCEGTPVTFSATATGDITGYQWYKNGAILTGATASTYSITAQTSMNGDKYTVVVKGTCGDKTSTEATLNVNAKPSISVNPVSTTKCVGDSYSFSVTASNAGGYQWFRDNRPISGATDATYSMVISCFSCGDAGNYKVNVYGQGACASNTITSSEVNLDTKAPLVLAGQLFLPEICEGSNATLSLSASGSITAFEWYKNGVLIDGQTSALFYFNVPLTDHGSKYSGKIIGYCNSVAPNEVTLSVKPLPAITTQIVGATKCEGESYTFNVSVTNAGSYQWIKNDVNISGATGSSYSIASLCKSCNEGTYKVRVLGAGVCAGRVPRSVLSDPANLAINTPVSIGTNPATQTVCEGTAVTFSVTASGDITGYQWYKNGAILTGATAPTYGITAQTSMNGDKYTVVVKGLCGDVTSTEATLNVNILPSISTQPIALTKCVGQSASFSVVATNAGSYQWMQNGSDITTATSTTYAIVSVCKTCDEGNYKVRINGIGACASNSITSNEVNLTINTPVSIGTNPATQTVCEGTAVTFSVTASGDITGYQWYKNGTILTGATSSTYGITAQTSMNGDKYTVVVKGLCGDVTSTEATLNVNTLPSISTQPIALNKCVGQSASFSVVATNAGSYQWMQNGSDIATATSTTYAIASVCKTCDEGNYKVRINGTGACASNSITSNEVNLTINTPVSIGTNPATQTVCEGTAVTFSVTASGDITGYQWYKNGAILTGATASTYGITAQTSMNGDKYTVVVKGLCGDVTSTEATLNVNALPSISTQPVGATKCVGEAYTFSVSASNASAFQWILNDVDISGATNATYALSNICKSCNEGSYKVRIKGTGACLANTIVSDPANLVVNIPVSISSQPTEQNVCSGSTATFRVKAIGDITGFQWYKNGIAITGATDSTYSVVGSANGDKFKVEVKGLCGNVVSNEVLINVTPTPIITQQPLAATKCVGESVTFSVTASNAGAYQWQFKGVNIAGATNASYTKNIDCADCDAGAYRVIVFGQGVCASSSVNGNEALLTVNRPMVITQQPQDASVCVNTNATFSVNATGSITGYQWYKNGVKIDGATASTYTFSTLSFNDGEKYKVEITGPCGALMSNEVNLQVKTITAPTISTNKPSGLCVGEQFILSATGCDGGIVHWFANNIEVAQGQTHTSSSTATFNAQCENLGCKSDLSNGITHVQYGQINVAAIAGRVTCFGDKDGAVEINPSGGAGAPFSIVWTNYNNNNFSRIVDLPAGLYNYTITDRIGCKVQGAIPVDRPSEPTGTASASDVVCFGQKNGKITLSGTSDYGGFQYVLNQAIPVAFGGGATTTVENLDKGSYTVKVIDAKGCTVLPNTTLQIQEPTQLKVTLQKTVRPKSFSSNDGAISVKISGGTQPYGVEWSLLPSTILNSNIQTTIAEDGINSQLSALGTGEYQVKATDKNLCNAILTQKIVAPDKISITSKIDSITCFGKADAKITLTVTGGVQLPTTPFYQVNWQRVIDGQAQTISNTTLDLSKLDKGTYQVTVLDSNGISEKQTFVLGEPTQLVTSVRQTIANYCASTPLGEVQILATGGRSPYSYTWDKTSQTTASINKLASGVYVATVTDKSGCVTTVQATVQDSISRYKMTTSYQPSTCFGRCDALLKSTVEGGIAPYQYTWSGINSTIANPINVCAGGTTQLMITDAKGCQIKSDNITMTSPDPRVIGLAAQVEVCPSKSFDLSASSLPWGKTYLWTYPDGKTQTTASIKADSLGTYTIQILDENSCGGVQQIKVIPTKNINVLFAMPSSAPVDKAVVAIDLTNPTPTTIAWEYPTSAKLVSQDAYSIKLTFPQVGKFKVKELATINNCVYTLTKEIQIIEKANDGSFPAPTATQPAMDFTIMGNPTSGNKVTLSIENVEKRAFDVSVQSATKGVLYQKSYSENDLKSLVVEIPENETEQVYFITLTSGDQKITKKVLIYR
ncbi:hypothetical protein QM480_21945 [Flectobacillus sp. DC10W]|uniref:Ig-like domain-containing protein n=1 Tax=Flectobacillus longus TaxID=2984207 RepID=A0ABT6YTV1_9BACT|nr:hypothetical protein [Flectobacillus longus]MDI9867018.1 hypothetical protein [Flectobacillus longus]